MTRHYPINLDVTGLQVVIVGGGAVAARKAAGLVAAGATRIRCIAPEFCPELPPAVERIRSRYSIEHLPGARLVFAATDDPEVNDAVVRDARAAGALVNRADSDEHEPGDFSTPALLIRGEVMVTASAASPALSAALRDDLAAKLDQRFVAMADAMQVLRPWIRKAVVKQGRRAEIFRELASAEALERLQAGGMYGVRDWLAERCPELRNA